jgi:DNA replication and repair protein RecF
VFVSAVRLVNFRSYRDATVTLQPGLNIVAGENAAGKTNLLEGAFYALRAASPRTRREDKLITWGEAFTRVYVRLAEHAGGTEPQHAMEVAYAPGQGKRIRIDGVEAAADQLRRRAQVFIFVPESLLLIKGSPARRRAHVDVFAAGLDPGYEAAHVELQAALRQRNMQLLRLRDGSPPSSLDPWDAQLAHAAVELGRRRRTMIAALAAHFAELAAALAPGDGRFGLSLVSQLAEIDYDEVACLAALQARRGREIQRGHSTFGPHRDDVAFTEGERDLRLFGSQGEQRAAVLALLLAERAVAEEKTGDLGTLFLDDVMSELDDSRRRLLVRLLTSPGQAIVTTTNLHYFTEEELQRAAIIQLPLTHAAAGDSVREGEGDSAREGDRVDLRKGAGGAADKGAGEGVRADVYEGGGAVAGAVAGEEPGQVAPGSDG